MAIQRPKTTAERILTKDYATDSVPPWLFYNDGEKRMFNLVGKDIVQDAAQRAWKATGAKGQAYTPQQAASAVGTTAKRETGGLFRPGAAPTASVNPPETAPAPAPQVDAPPQPSQSTVDESLLADSAGTDAGVPDVPNTNPVNTTTPQQTNGGWSVDWKSPWTWGGLATTALLTYLFLDRRSRNKKRRRMQKYGGAAYSMAKRNDDNIAVLDEMMGAQTPKDYAKVNRDAAAAAEKNNHSTKGKPATAYRPLRFNVPFMSPGGEGAPMQEADYAGTPFFNASKASALEKTPVGRETYARDGVGYAPRQSRFTSLAASMLPTDENTSFSMDPSIGNMAYSWAPMMGAWAGDSGMSDEDRQWAADNALDEAVLRAVVQQTGKYPMFRNSISAYVNGGFGDSSRPADFGMSGGLWDFDANALTPLGTNYVDTAVSDIGKTGGLRPTDAGSTTAVDDAKAQKLRSEMLRFFDEVGPSVFTPTTVLGHEMVYNPTYGWIDNLSRLNSDYFEPYYRANPNWLKDIDKAQGWPGRDTRDSVSLALKKFGL